MSIDHFAGINDGDKVRVEFADGAYEGVWDAASDCLLPHEGDATSRKWLTRWPITRVTVLRRALPPEPAVGAIVITQMNNAVQRAKDGWYFALVNKVALTWDEVVASGPLRVLWTPEEGK